MRKKKQHTFTLNEDLVNWFREYSSLNDRTMSSLINSYILELKLENQYSPKVKFMTDSLENDNGNS